VTWVPSSRSILSSRVTSRRLERFCSTTDCAELPGSAATEEGSGPVRGTAGQFVDGLRARRQAASLWGREGPRAKLVGRGRSDRLGARSGGRRAGKGAERRSSGLPGREGCGGPGGAVARATPHGPQTRASPVQPAWSANALQPPTGRSLAQSPRNGCQAKESQLSGSWDCEGRRADASNCL